LSLVPANVQATIAADRARDEQAKTANAADGATRSAEVDASADVRKPLPGASAAAAPATAPAPPQMPGTTVAATSSAQEAAPESTGGPKSSVQGILARARAAPDAAPPARGGPFVPAPSEATLTRTAPLDVSEGPRPKTMPAQATSIAAATTQVAPPTQLLSVPRAPATQKMPLDPGLKLTFAPGSRTLSAPEQTKLALATAKARLAPGARVTLILGPASSDSAFERLITARRRGEAVATLLPHGLEIVQDYQPELPPDAVWVVFRGRYASEVVSQ
jgi:hypothetical protein